MGNDLIKGTTFVDGGMINAANLNAHVDDAVLKYTCINSKPHKTPNAAVTDEFLINDSGTLKKINGGDIYDMCVQPGTVIQSIYGTYSANASLATLIPLDDTIPQITEGTQIISVSFTPRFINSQMVLRFSGVAVSSGGTGAIVAIFRDSGADAIAATVVTAPANTNVLANILATDLPATISTVTYTVRAGPSAVSTFRFNGSTTVRFFGGVMAATLEVQELIIA